MTHVSEHHILAAALSLVDKRLTEHKRTTAPAIDVDALVDLINSVVDKRLNAHQTNDGLAEDVESRVNVTIRETKSEILHQLGLVEDRMRINVDTNSHATISTVMGGYYKKTLDESYTKQEEFESHNHDAEYAFKTDHEKLEEDVVSLVQAFGEATANEIDGVIGKLSDNYNEVIATTDNLKSDILKLEDVSSSEISSLSDRISAVGNDVDVNGIAIGSLSKSISGINESIDSIQSKNSSDNKTLLKKVDALSASKADVSHTHDEYLTSDHVVAINAYINDLDSALHKKIDSVGSMLDDKLSTDDGVTKDDLIALRNELIELKDNAIKSAISSIPKPKDGLNWEFRPHPSQQGTIMFKREDDPAWRQVVLFNPKILKELVTSVNKIAAGQAMGGYQSAIGMGGPAYTNPRELVNQSNIGDLSDVTIAHGNLGQNGLLMYDSVSATWKPKSLSDLAALLSPMISSGGVNNNTLNGIPVVLTNPTPGDFLIYDGTEIENSALLVDGGNF